MCLFRNLLKKFSLDYFSRDIFWVLMVADQYHFGSGYNTLSFLQNTYVHCSKLIVNYTFFFAHNNSSSRQNFSNIIISSINYFCSYAIGTLLNIAKLHASKYLHCLVMSQLISSTVGDSLIIYLR